MQVVGRVEGERFIFTCGACSGVMSCSSSHRAAQMPSFSIDCSSCGEKLVVRNPSVNPSQSGALPASSPSPSPSPSPVLQGSAAVAARVALTQTPPVETSDAPKAEASARPLRSDESRRAKEAPRPEGTAPRFSSVMPRSSVDRETPHSSRLDKLETALLFPATRLVSWLMIVVLSVAAVGGVLFFRTLSSDSEVTWDMVRRQMSIDESEEVTKAKKAEIQIPKKFDKYFKDDRDVLLGWLVQLDESQRGEFLDGMWVVIKGAEAEDPTRLVEAINGYSSLKIAAFREKEQNRTMIRIMQIVAVLVVLLVLGLAAIFALVIAILSLERKSRVAGSGGALQAEGIA